MKNLLPRFLVHLQVKATSLKSLQYGHMMSGKFVTSSTTADGATSQRGRSAQHDRLQRSVLRSRGPPPHPRRRAASLRHGAGAPSCGGRPPARGRGPPAAGQAAGRRPARTSCGRGSGRRTFCSGQAEELLRRAATLRRATTTRTENRKNGRSGLDRF